MIRFPYAQGNTTEYGRYGVWTNNTFYVASHRCKGRGKAWMESGSLGKAVISILLEYLTLES